MAGLFDGLSTATSALRTFQIGLEVTGQNIANINTVGYTRRLLDLSERRPTETLGPGRGVDVTAIRAARDYYVLGRLAREGAGMAKDAAILENVGMIDAEIGLPGSSVDARITAFFDSFSNFAVDVTSAAARDDVVRQGQALAGAIGTMSARITGQQQAADVSLRDGTVELNALSERVAALNANIIAGAPDVESLRDERDVLINRMSELVDVALIQRPDGAVDVTVANGQAIVIGATAYGVQTTSTPPSGFAALSVHGTDITAAITNGRLGGLIELRDSVLPRYHAALDQMAFDLTREVNTRHAAGFDGNGAPAGNFFVPLAGVAGAAQAMAVESAIVADSQLVAGGSVATAGDNQTARAIAGLRDASVMSGGTTTPAGAWGQFVYEVGSDVSAAQAASLTREQVMRQLEMLRDQASGVSLDEEAANLMRYQRSYEASARYFTTIVDTLDTLMTMVR
jgi:flagellar hook-associated protein 1 FlgK